ncbi:hypothetical protein ISCGN_019485 [Ixodes scapularis]
MDRNTGSSSNGDGTFSATQLRLPAFWAKNPWAWFSQVEAQFHLRRITTQESRYYHVVSALPPEVADELDDVLALPPPENAYDHIKETILARKAASEASRIQQLLTTEELGDRRPSQLLHRMRQLLAEEDEKEEGEVGACEERERGFGRLTKDGADATRPYLRRRDQTSRGPTHNPLLTQSGRQPSGGRQDCMRGAVEHPLPLRATDVLSLTQAFSQRPTASSLRPSAQTLADTWS